LQCGLPQLSSISKNIRSDPKSFWNVVNSKKGKSVLPNTLNDCSDQFAKFFGSVDSPTTYNQTDYPLPLKNFSISLPFIDTKSILELAINIKPSFKCGPDGIPPLYLNHVYRTLPTPFLGSSISPFTLVICLLSGNNLM